MGYDVHITRADDWTEAESTPISMAEWLAYVEADTEMRFDGYAEAPLPDGRVFRIESPGLCVWTKYSLDGQDANHAWFNWSKGRVVVKNPDEEILRKMHVIALHLHARVQGDDGELYDADGNVEPGE